MVTTVIYIQPQRQVLSLANDNSYYYITLLFSVKIWRKKNTFSTLKTKNVITGDSKRHTSSLPTMYMCGIQEPLSRFLSSW